jgi:hypothetical protein
LKEWLSPQQLAQYDEHKYFDVTGSHTRRTYRIRVGRDLNVFELDDAGLVQVGWLPVDGLVAGDVMLAQQIALETDELYQISAIVTR